LEELTYFLFVYYFNNKKIKKQRRQNIMTGIKEREGIIMLSKLYGLLMGIVTIILI
jgi:hypothetical protein